MAKVNYEQMNQCLMLLKSSFSALEVDELTVYAWLITLADCEGQEVLKATLHLMESFQGFSPKASDLKESINILNGSSWSKAYAEVLENSGRVYDRVEWSKSEINEVLRRMGGLRTFAEAPANQSDILRAQFREIHKQVMLEKNRVNLERKAEILSSPKYQQLLQKKMNNWGGLTDGKA